MLAKLEEGKSIREVVARFEIDKNIILSWEKRLEMKRFRPRNPSKIDDQVLEGNLEKYPDSYQFERAIRFNCSKSAISDALKRLAVIVKKDFKLPQSHSSMKATVPEGVWSRNTILVIVLAIFAPYPQWTVQFQ